MAFLWGLTWPRISGFQRQKCILEPGVLPTLLRRGHIHGSPISIIFPVSIPSHRPNQVFTRCYTTLVPWSPSYLSAHLTPAADLYGPFWTLTTLIFCLYVFSSLAHSIVSYLSDEPIDYDFSLLSTAFALVYAYGLGWPALLWVGLRYYGLGEWSIIEAIAVWGYGQFVWIPVSVRRPPSNFEYRRLNE